MIEYYPPTNPAEWIEAIAAGVTILLGLIMLLMPRALASTGAEVSLLRGHLGGLVLGLGLAALLRQQPLIYLAMGIAWGFSVLGQLWSFIIDRKLSTKKFAWLILKSGLAIMTILAVLGYFG